MTVIQIARTPAGWVSRARARRRGLVPAMTTSATLVVASCGLLLGGGLIMILSASWVNAYQRYGSAFMFFQRQAMWAAVGVVAMIAVSRIDYRKFRGLGYGILLVAMAGLVLVLHGSFGSTVSGSQRWLNLGPLRFQPSELAKLGVLLVCADLCARKGPRLKTVKDVFVPIGLVVAVVGGLIMLQPDLGTTLIVAGIFFTILFVAGTPGGTMATFGFGGVAATAALAMSSGYRRARIFSFIDPFKDKLGAGYQAAQAQIALGSGGLFGVGLGASRQKWMYVPNAHTDFIFAIIGEEVGLLGCFIVLGLFALFGYAGVRIARRAPDTFGRIVAAGITAWIVGQAIVNMGAVTGMLPITGVPLPLVSFGGSSLVFTLIGIGILLNIARQEQWPQRAAAGAPPKRRARARRTRATPTRATPTRAR
jgi:cell division protein FtsW